MVMGERRGCIGVHGAYAVSNRIDSLGQQCTRCRSDIGIVGRETGIAGFKIAIGDLAVEESLTRKIIVHLV